VITVEATTLAKFYKMLSYRRYTALQDALVFAKDWNWETIFYGHNRSIFNHCDIWACKAIEFVKKRKIMAITPSRSFKVIEVGAN